MVTLDETGKAAECDPVAFPTFAKAAVVSSGMRCSGFVMGSGTEQYESTTMLGRPVMMLSVLSSEYRLHHICTRDSRLVELAEGSSFRTWSPRA